MEHTKSIIGSLLLGFFLLFCNYLSANNLNQVMQQANEAYQQKDYATSIDLYQQIVEAGNEGAILYYNLGNAYFKNDELAKAVLWYERARRLDPRNEDIQHNIAFVNQKLIDKIDVLPELFITRWWKGVSQSFTSNGWAIASIIFSALFFLFLALFLLLKNPRIKSLSILLSIICIVLLIFSILFAHQEKNRYEKHPEAIVMDLVLNVKSSPDEKSNDLFVIHEGLKVSLTDRIGEWVEIKLPNGDKGWVKSKTIEEI